MPRKRVEGRAELTLDATRTHEASERVYRLIKPVFDAAPFALRIMGESRPLAYAVKSRIKGLRDIVEKVERKRNGTKPGDLNYVYEPDHVTDGCGFRIVTLFQEDQISVIGELIKMIQHNPPYTDNPIDKNQPLKEVAGFTFQVRHRGWRRIPRSGSCSRDICAGLS